MIRSATVAAAMLLLLLAPVASAQEPRASLPDIEDEVMCTICGTLLEFSEAPQAERERALIRRLIDEGRTKGQIEDALVAEYGDEVLATPGDNGFDLAAWLVPGLAIAAAAIGIAIYARRRIRRQEPGPAPEPLEVSDSSRLDEDMSRYDL